MANIAQSVNVISPLMTSKEGIVKQTTWWPLWLFCKYMRGWTIGTHVRGTAYDGTTEPAWLQSIVGEQGGASWLDVSACVNEEGVVTLVVVNIHETQNIKADVIGSVLKGKGTKAYTITGASIKSVNVAGKEEVKVKETTWDGAGGKYTFGRHSITMLRWETGNTVSETTTEVFREKTNARTMAWATAITPFS